MSVPQDGGPAFPIPAITTANAGVIASAIKGMSLRDWFAGMALQGFISNEKRVIAMACATPDGTDLALALASYSVADAMLSARDRKESA